MNSLCVQNKGEFFVLIYILQLIYITLAAFPHKCIILYNLIKYAISIP